MWVFLFVCLFFKLIYWFRGVQSSKRRFLSFISGYSIYWRSALQLVHFGHLGFFFFFLKLLKTLLCFCINTTLMLLLHLSQTMEKTALSKCNHGLCIWGSVMMGVNKLAFSPRYFCPSFKILRNDSDFFFHYKIQRTSAVCCKCMHGCACLCAYHACLCISICRHINTHCPFLGKICSAVWVLGGCYWVILTGHVDTGA